MAAPPDKSSVSKLMKRSTQKTCLKCDEGGNILFCTVLDCPVAIHETCMSCRARFDNMGNFRCPYCLYKQWLVESRLAKEKALLAKRALLDFLDMAVTDTSTHRQSVEAQNRDSTKISQNDRSVENGEEDNYVPICACTGSVPQNEGGELSMVDERRDVLIEGGSERAMAPFEVLPTICDIGLKMNVERYTCDDAPVIERLAGEEQHAKLLDDSDNVSSEDNNLSLHYTHSESRSPAKANGAREHVETERDQFEETDNVQRRECGTGDESSLCENDYFVSYRTDVNRRIQMALMSNIDDRTDIEVGKDLNNEGAAYSESRRGNHAREMCNRTPALQRKRRKKLPWTAEEVEMLKEGVEKFSSTANKNLPWRKILEFGRHVFEGTRMPVDLKDKWRNVNGERAYFGSV